MKETINRLTEKQIALITLALTIVALVIGIAMPEIRTALGLEGSSSSMRPAEASMLPENALSKSKQIEEMDNATPPAPPTAGKEKKLPRVEIKKDYANSSMQNGEFIVFSGVTFKNSGYLTGKVIIQKGATFKNMGTIEGEVINKGGTFTNTGYLDGPLTVE